MTVREMVEKHLKDNGYDGLGGDGCGCILADLIPCVDAPIEHCEAGHRVPCDCGEECNFHIVPGKRP